MPEESVVVAPGGAGLVRMAWDGKRSKEDLLLLKVEMWMQPQGERKARQIVPLLALVSFVPPVRVEPRQINVKNWSNSGVGQAEFVVWSSTRARFRLDPLRPKLAGEKQKDDPCVDQPRITPLTATECRELEKASQEQHRHKLPTHVLSGYRVQVTVYQEKDGVQLEHGHFQRWIDLASDAMPALPGVMVMGNVQGGVEIEPDGVVKLGSFPAAEGKTSDAATLLWLEPGVELLPKKVEVKPEGMKVKLEKIPPEESGPKVGWKLWVTIPPNAVAGEWPGDSAIMLYTKKGKQERRIRIPVEANPNAGAP